MSDEDCLNKWNLIFQASPEDIAKQMQINAKIIMQAITDYANKEIKRFEDELKKDYENILFKCKEFQIMDWIKLKKEDKPEGDVIVYNGVHVKPAVVEFDKEGFYFYDGVGKMDGITHWMSMPKPPKE